MDKKLKRLLREDMQKEADHISKMLDNRPEEEKEDLPASDYMEVLVSLQKFAETEAKLEEERKAQAEKTKAAETQAQPEEAQSRLSSEEQELIRLGGVYKKRRKWNRLAILVAALVCVLSLGLTATGGPDKLFQEIRWKLAGREQTNIDSDDDRVVAPDDVSEDEAYEKIEEVFGFYPVKLYYLPEGMTFTESTYYGNMKNIQLIYEGKNKGVLIYRINTDYRTSSSAMDVEDTLFKEYDEVIKGIVINIKQYEVEGNRERWKVTFIYKDVHYSLVITDIKEKELKKIVENLFFS